MIEKLRILPWSMCRLSVAAPSGGTIEAHQPVREAVPLDVADVPEAGPLEGSPGSAVRLLDGRDGFGRRRVGEDDVAGERGPDARADARPTRSDSPRSSGRRPDALDDLFPLRMSETRHG
jgi:hypothetical protein